MATIIKYPTSVDAIEGVPSFVSAHNACQLDGDAAWRVLSANSPRVEGFCTGFNFHEFINEQCVIRSVMVYARYRCAGARLYMNGVVAGKDLSTVSTPLMGSDDHSYVFDLTHCKETWSPTDFADDGFKLRVGFEGSEGSAELDSVRVEVIVDEQSHEIEPDADGNNIQWTPSSNKLLHHEAVSRQVFAPAVPDKSSYISTLQKRSSEEWTYSTVKVKNARGVKIWLYGYHLGVEVSINKGGVWSVAQVVSPTLEDRWTAVIFPGFYSQREIDDLQVRVKYADKTQATDKTAVIYASYIEVFEGGSCGDCCDHIRIETSGDPAGNKSWLFARDGCEYRTNDGISFMALNGFIWTAYLYADGHVRQWEAPSEGGCPPLYTTAWTEVYNEVGAVGEAAIKIEAFNCPGQQHARMLGESSNSAGNSSSSSSSSISSSWAPTGCTIYDFFNRANTATNIGTTTSGHTWSQIQGTWGIVTNQAYRDSGQAQSSENLVAISNGWADADVSLALATNNGYSGVVLRNDGTYSNFIMWYALGTGTVQLWTRISGVWAQIDSVSATVNPGSRIRLTAQGSEIKGYMNGVLLTTQTISDANLNTNTGVGMYEENGANTRFEDFCARQMSSSSSSSSSALGAYLKDYFLMFL